MISRRLQRLQADFNRVNEAFARHPYIKCVETTGTPPDKYIFEFTVDSLVPASDDSFVSGALFLAEVFLPLEYPKRPPFCRMLTPVYHPNIDPRRICIGDHWSAGESLVHLVARIAEMLCYQSYNTKSPLNARAAAWAEQNLDRLPLFTGDLRVGL